MSHVSSRCFINLWRQEGINNRFDSCWETSWELTSNSITCYAILCSYKYWLIETCLITKFTQSEIFVEHFWSSLFVLSFSVFVLFGLVFIFSVLFAFRFSSSIAQTNLLMKNETSCSHLFVLLKLFYGFDSHFDKKSC